MNKSFYIQMLALSFYSFSPIFGESSPSQDNVHPVPAWMLEAAEAARKELHLIDQGQYKESWLKGDELFQKITSKEEWIHILKDMREPLGTVKQRALKRETPAYDPKGLPDGEYMIIEYLTSFEKGAQAEERMTLRRGSDSQWRMLTYRLYYHHIEK